MAAAAAGHARSGLALYSLRSLRLSESHPSRSLCRSRRFSCQALGRKSQHIPDWRSIWPSPPPKKVMVEMNRRRHPDRPPPANSRQSCESSLCTAALESVVGQEVAPSPLRSGPCCRARLRCRRSPELAPKPATTDMICMRAATRLARKTDLNGSTSFAFYAIDVQIIYECF